MILGFFKKISTPLPVGLITAVTILMFWLINTHHMPGIPNNHAVNEVGLPDMTVRYSPSLAYGLFDAYGEAGRNAYAAFLVRVDFIFPLIYGFFFVMVTTFCFLRIFPKKPSLQKWTLLPLATTLFDFCENCCFLVMLRNYPTHLNGVARVANLFTLAKWGFALISVVVLLLALVGLLLTKILPRKINQTV